MKTMKRRLQTEGSLIVYYQSISTLPLNIFISCLDGGQFDLLVKDNPNNEIPDSSKIVDIWNDLQGEYNDALALLTHKSYLLLKKSISELEITIEILEPLLPLLERVKVPRLIPIVNEELDTSFEFDDTNREEYLREINVCKAMVGSLQLRLAVKNQQLDAISGKKKDKEGKVNSKMRNIREQFIDSLIALSKHANHRVDDSITTLEYCRRVKDFNEYRSVIENNKKG